MKISRVAGTTGEVMQIFIQDSSSSTGGGLTGLTNSSAGLTAYYCRNDQGTATVISLIPMTAGTFTSGGFAVIDGTNMPGWYQFCPPNAVFTSGRSAGIHLKGATNMAPLPIEIELTAVDNQDGAGFGMSRVDTTVSSRLATSAIPTNFALLSIDASGRVDVIKVAGTTQTARDLGASVLLSSGTGTGQILLSSGKVVTPDDQKVDLNTIKTQSVTCSAGVTVLASVGTAATSTAQTGDSYALANGASGFVAIKGDTAAILIDTGTTLDAFIQAIRAKTDSLTFTVANKVDANVKYVNDVAVDGAGTSGDPWGPA